MAGFQNWQQKLLGGLGMPVTPNNLKFLTAWQGAEGGSAAFNPLNTTQGMPGATDYNSVHVRNYLNPAVGLQATLKTLRNGYYPAILAALKSGNPTWNPVLAKNLSTWGTGSSWMQGYRDTGVPTSSPGGGPSKVTPPRSVVQLPPKPQFRTVTSSKQVFDPSALASGIFSSLATGGLPNIASLVPQSYQTVTQTQRIPIGAPVRSKNATHTEGPPVPATPVTANLAATAAKQLGQPYVWGAESRKEGGFDCSGLVDWSLRQQGYKGPRVTTYTLKNMGQSVQGKSLRPGDLVLCNNYEHVVIYAGNGKVIAAPHTGAVVQYQPLSQFHVNDVRRL